MKALVRQTYQEFIRKLWGKPTFVYDESDRDESCIDTFKNLLDKEYGLESIGRTFIYDYFCFQLDYWKNMETRFGKKIPIAWFIGKKAFERWKNNPEEDLWHAYQTAEEFGIHIGLIHTAGPVTFDVLELKESEETEKTRFHNTNKGMLNCIESTTLYNHRSPLCISCNFKKECKKLLESNYYRIWIKRGYSEKNSSKARKRA